MSAIHPVETPSIDGRGEDGPQHGTRARRGMTGIVLAGAVVTAVALGSVLIFGGYSQVEGTAAPGVPTTFDVTGSISLTDTPYYGTWYTGGTCAGDLGYADLREGATIHIRRDGALVAQGNLGRGKATSRTQCIFDVAVDDVPYRPGVYTWEVSHRGELILDVVPGQKALARGSIGD